MLGRFGAGSVSSRVPVPQGGVCCSWGACSEPGMRAWVLGTLRCWLGDWSVCVVLT